MITPHDPKGIDGFGDLTAHFLWFLCPFPSSSHGPFRGPSIACLGLRKTKEVQEVRLGKCEFSDGSHLTKSWKMGSQRTAKNGEFISKSEKCWGI